MGDNMSESMGDYISESLGDFVGIGKWGLLQTIRHTHYLEKKLHLGFCPIAANQEFPCLND